VVSDGERYELFQIRRAVDLARLAAIGNVRVYRRTVVGTAIVLLIAAVLFAAFANLLDPKLVILHGTTAGVAGSDGASTRDVSTVEAWGVLGSFVAVVVGLRRLSSSRTSVGLQVAQLALKVPAGALTAVFGIVLLQSSIIPGLKAVDETALGAYAVLFGFAQEALTRLVDNKAGQLIDQAQPLSERTATQGR
jgi:hypothetical protein